jgi:gliding motility-associated-like protein
MKSTFCILTFFLATLSFSIKAQSTAPCGVRASFTPAAKDSIFTDEMLVWFESTSTNATSLKWYMNGFLITETQAFNYAFNISGLYEIMLIASNGSCSDTSIAIYVLTGNQPPNRDNIKVNYGFPFLENNATSLVAGNGGGYLAGGYVSDVLAPNGAAYFESGMLIKIKESGCAEWTKTLRRDFYTRVGPMIALKDSGFLVTGVSDNRPFYLNIDPKGNQRWCRSFEINGLLLEPVAITETEDDHFLVAGTLGNLASEGLSIAKIHADGTVKWVKQYFKFSNPFTSYYPSKILVKGNDVYVACETVVYTGPSSQQNIYGNLMKLDYTTGATRWTKSILVNNSFVNPRDLAFYNDGLVMNAFATTGVVNPVTTLIHLDTSGTPRWAKTLSTPPFFYVLTSNTKLHPLKNGDWYISSFGAQPLNLQPYSFAYSFFIKTDALFNLKWAKEYSKYFNSPLPYTTVGAKDAITGLGKEFGFGIEAYISASSKLTLLKMDSSGNDPNGVYCDITDIDIFFTNQTAGNNLFIWDNETTAAGVLKPDPLSINTKYADVFFACPTDFIDSCSYIKLYGPDEICALNTPVEYKLRRNKGCSMPVTWSYPSTGVSVIRQTDTSLVVTFNSFQSAQIGASLEFSCTPVKDSMVTAIKPKGNLVLNLGADTTLCSGNSITLRAGNKFLNYFWSNGSNDSTIVINAAGTYWVRATDSCKNILTDTIHVTAAPPVPLSIGADRTKCNNDTLRLTAPAGFMNYSWGPVYNINSTNTQQVVVNPSKDTIYYVKAEKTPGCFGFDTVFVKVNSSPPIDLGADVRFCNGDSIVLRAGNGFTNYTWSNGATTAQLIVKAQGTYSVKATTAQGCSSTDTMQVLQVYANPVVRLNKDSLLCSQSTRTLDAGSYASYVWSTGQQTGTITVANTGTYSVTVTDANGCKGRDTTVITRLLPLPSRFLGKDTSICSYGTLELQATAGYKTYLWSNGATTPKLNISKPGQYVLTVTDGYNCTGADTVNVALKQCLTGFYMPNAFTPNGDGTNDDIHPLLFGDVLDYEFAVYNRFGTVVFFTKQPGTGWNGLHKGIPQDPGTFTWKCSFQLKGAPKEQRTGTLHLVR